MSRGQHMKGVLLLGLSARECRFDRLDERLMWSWTGIYRLLETRWISRLGLHPSS
jgi:hypothetical protein